MNDGIGKVEILNEPILALLFIVDYECTASTLGPQRLRFWDAHTCKENKHKKNFLFIVQVKVMAYDSCNYNISFTKN